MPSTTTPPRPDQQDPAVTEFLHQLEQGRGVSPNTVRNYRQALLEFKATVPDKSWWELKPADFKAYLYRLARGQQLGPSSVRLRFAALRTFYKLAVARGQDEVESGRRSIAAEIAPAAARSSSTTNRLPRCSMPRVNCGSTRKNGRPPARARRTAAARKTGRCCATSRGWSFFTARACACRNWCRCRRRNLDLHQGTVRVLGKGRKERLCPLGDPAVRALEAYLDACPFDGEALFVSAQGQAAQRAHRAARAEALSRRGGTRCEADAAQVAPHLRDASARSRRRPAQRAGTARPQPAHHHANLHFRLGRAAEAGL